jgi:hypothetical protein
MILTIPGRAFFDLTAEGPATVVRCRSCRAEVEASGPRALLVHADGCEVLELVRDLERGPKPFLCRVGRTGTELHHEARLRLA